MQDFEVELPASLVVKAINTVMEPQTVQQALMEPDADKWIKALEYNDMIRNNTWKLVERPKGKNILSSKWGFVR